MQKSKLLLILIAAVLLSGILTPGIALADDDDFDVRFEISPQDVGFWGGIADVIVTVTNTGETNITWIEVRINNERPYTGDWTGTIPPGESRTISFSPRFATADLETPRILQVSMNNNATANPDGVKMMNFQVGEITNIFDASCTVSPVQAVYRPGETVNVTHSFTNNVETHAALNVQSTITMMIGSRSIYDGVAIDHGDVFPGQTVTSSFRYTFEEDDEGIVNVYYRLNFSLMDQAYDLQDFTKQFEVRSISPAFSAALYAEPLTVAAGDSVTFRIAIGNTGDSAISRFEVTDLGGATVAEADGLPAGGAGSVTLSLPVYETGDFSYVVVGSTGTSSRSLETNTVHVTVEGAAESASPGSSSSSASDTPDASSVFASPAATLSDGSTADPSSPQESAAGELSAMGSAGNTNTVLPVVLIGVIAAAVGVTVLLLILLKKRKKNN